MQIYWLLLHCSTCFWEIFDKTHVTATHSTFAHLDYFKKYTFDRFTVRDRLLEFGITPTDFKSRAKDPNHQYIAYPFIPWLMKLYILTINVKGPHLKVTMNGYSE